MDMEQRVGRVHRFGSVKSIIVETLVLSGSREERVLERCRAKLFLIAKNVETDPLRIERLFSRTMSLIPWEELAELMAGEDFGPLSEAEEKKLAKLVNEGFRRWQESDEEFRKQAEIIQNLRRGNTVEDDLLHFVRDKVKASELPGWTRQVLISNGNECGSCAVEEPAIVLELPDGSRGFIGRDAGVGLKAPEGIEATPQKLGLNHPAVADKIREFVGWTKKGDRQGGRPVSGVARIRIDERRWNEFMCLGDLPAEYERGAIALAYVVRRLNLQDPIKEEVGADLVCYCLPLEGDSSSELDPVKTADLIRLIRSAKVIRNLPDLKNKEKLIKTENEIMERLRVTQPGKPTNAVFPIVAAVIEIGD